MLTPLDLIDTPHPNPCSVPVPPEADAALLRCVQRHGVLSAILLRPAGNRFELVFGFRRLAAARAAGLVEIPSIARAMTELEVREAQVIENQHRRQMHPVDQWRAVADMLKAGESLTDAAIALGYPEQETRRMERLAALHPKIRDLVIQEMPSMSFLKVIAAASHRRQLEALKVQYAIQSGRMNWHIVAGACRDATIPRGRAIFDVDASNIEFEEDLFAQPGAEDQFYTKDVEGFMRVQRVALAARVSKDRAKGKRIAHADWARGGFVLPRGYTRRFDSTPPRTLKGTKGPTLFVTICEGGDDIGKVIEVLADPPAPLAKPAAPVSSSDEHAEPVRAVALQGLNAPERRSPLESEPEIERPPITNRGRQIIAATKTAALRDHLRAEGNHFSVELLAGCLVLALSGNNTRVADDVRYSSVDFDDLALRLVGADGRVDVDGAPIDEILAEALARMLIVTDPVTGHGSGKVAEWIGNALDADIALPRYDTPEFLATLAKRELVAIAATVDVAVPNKVTALREVLAGKAPAYRPTTFGAPGPRPERTPRSTQPEADELVV